jgi:hypothetical protein
MYGNIDLTTIVFPSLLINGARGSVVVTALCYKPEGRGSIPDEVIFKFT